MNNITGLIPTAMSLALVDENLHQLKKKKKKKITDLAVNNIVGVSLIKATAQSI